MISELSPRTHQTEKAVDSSPHLYWFSGLTGTTASGDEIIPELERAMRSLNTQEEETGESEKSSPVTYLHSIASGEETNTDPSSPENRYTKYATEILERLKNGQETVIMAHSFGAQEVDRLFDELDGSEEFHKNIDKLTIVLLAPYGLIEKATKAPRLLRFVEIARAQMPLGPFNSFRQGLESLAYLPPSDISEDAIEGAVDALYSDATEYKNLRDENIPTFRTIRKDEGAFVRLPPEVQEEIRQSVSQVDTQLAEAIREKNWLVCKHLLKRRGKILNKNMETAYKSSMSLEMYATMAQAELGIAGLYNRILKGKAFSRLQRISKTNEHGKKPQIKAIMPEYDVIYSIKELQELLDCSQEEVHASIAILTATTHNSMALNARGLGEAVAHLLKQVKPEHPQTN